MAIVLNVDGRPRTVQFQDGVLDVDTAAASLGMTPNALVKELKKTRAYAAGHITEAPGAKEQPSSKGTPEAPGAKEQPSAKGTKEDAV